MMDWPTQQGLFGLGDFALQKGGVLPDAKLSWKAHGTLSAACDNVILYPTSFSVHHSDIEWLIGPDGVLDPGCWFIVIADMFGNGLSTSRSNSNAYPPLLTIADNVRAQRQLLDQVFGVSKLACVYGWSMGALQAYHWAALYPQAVERIVVNCGSARTAPHNKVFLAGLLALLEAAPEYAGEGRFHARPHAALRAFGRAYAGWALSQEFYREELYRDAFAADSLEMFLERVWDGRFAARHASDLHAHLTTWYYSDIGNNDLYGGNLIAALKAITARVLLMPGRSDLYFRVADNERELPHLANARLTPIPSDWGHLAGNPQRNPADAAFLREHVRAWLAA
jgi:homoserine O-acetyltransferase/O-succinyltransferase